MQKKIVSALLVCFMVVFTSAAVQSEEKKRPLPSKEDENISFDIPRIDEVFKQAKRAGIADGWEKRIEIKSQGFKAMPEPQRAVEVGKTLADIAFLVLDKEEGKKPSGNLLEKAENAILSLNPSQEIETQLKELRGSVLAGTLAGEKLRKELDRLIKDVIPKIMKGEEGKDDAAEKRNDVGVMVWAAGFCRAMYLGTSTVAEYDKPDKDKLSMFRYGGVLGYFIKYFTEEASDSFKKDTMVKNLVITFKKVKSVVDKKRDEFTKQDIVKVSKTLKREFG